MNQQLSVVESLKYKDLKDQARAGWQEADQGWSKWLAAVKEIRDTKLYRKEYGTFEDFCQLEFGVTRQRVYQLMDANSIAAGLGLTLSPRPQFGKKTLQIYVDSEGLTHGNLAEHTARELGKIPPEKRQEVVNAAARNGTVNSTTIRREAARIAEAEPPSLPVDTMGFPIPKVSLPYWERRHEIQDLMSAISKVRGALKCYQDNKDPWLCDLNNALSQHLTSAFLTISDRKPDVVCPYCEGKFSYTDEYGKHECKACFKTGLMAKALFERVPPQFRERRAKALK